MQTDSITNPLATLLTLGIPNAETPHAKNEQVATLQPKWPEVVRDISAIANSGGGKLEIEGNIDLSELFSQLHHYTAADFTDVSIDESHDGPPRSILTIGPSHLPIEFAGAVYFRHGNRSEPATAEDIHSSFERLLNHARRRWSRTLRRSLNTPLDRLVARPRKRRALTSPKQIANLQWVRITNDPAAPALHPQDVDRLYPWRQKDLVRELNRRFGGRVLNSYDIQAVRRHHHLDEHPDFIFNLPGAGRRYSPAAADWIANEYVRDSEFFHKARVADQEQLKLRRKKPK